MDNYDSHRLSLKENISYLLQGLLITIVLGLLFYRSTIAVLLLSPVLYFYRKRKADNLIKERKWQLNLEFKEGITALSAALEAGYSAEHAFEEACRDLSRVFNEKSLVIREFQYITNQIHMNITVEKALSDFAKRSGVEDILSFSEIFCTAKRTGGDLINIIKITSSVISDKIEVKREIRTLVTAKRLEANIMKVIPLFILIYLTFSSPGFLNPLYHNVTGIAVMTIFLICYLGAYILIDKIIDIEV
jgi:tight adherence protein B